MSSPSGETTTTRKKKTTMIDVKENIDLYEKIGDYDLIFVGTNINCNMAQGFQRKVMLNYPFVQEQNMLTRYGDLKKLGTIVECKEEGSPTFVLMYITKGNYRPDLQADFLSYEALDKCMALVNVLYKGRKAACTLLGGSRFDGNGDRDKILDILEKSSQNLSIDVYDYHQKTVAEELKEIRERELAIKAVDRDAYYRAVNERKRKAKELRAKNGHAGY